jgi:hypothetical protein
MLSFFGSSWIIYDSLSKKQKRSATYHQILIGMSTFDIFGSLAHAFSTSPIPVYDSYHDPSGVYGAVGNDATCTAQGFFIQLGFTTIFYNIALSCYYQLAIIRNWKEGQFKAYKLWFHVPTVLVGFCLAFGAIPFYHNQIVACWVPPPPVEDEWVQLVFAHVPVALVIVVSTVSMFRVVWAAEKTDRNAQKWRMGTVVSRSIFVSEVRWQAAFYLGAFYLSWPILIANNFVGFYARNTTAWGPILNYMTAFLFPLQGFLSKNVYNMVCRRLGRNFF